MSGVLAGTGGLLRLILRRDRLLLLGWLGGLGGTIAWSTWAVVTLYDTPQEVAGYAASVADSPVIHLTAGRQAGLDTLGGVTANELSFVVQLGVCVMVLFLVVRHTRAEEESGRAELLRATLVGRHAGTIATLTYAGLGAAAVGAATSAAMLAAGLDARGSLTYGLGVALLGACFAAVTLACAQVSAGARGARAIAGALLAAAFLVRGVGAMQDSALVWLSPFAWAQEMNAFGAERWWPALLLVAGTAAALTGAAVFTARRDFGAGLIPPRPGRPRAVRLGSGFALAWRLQRGARIGWLVGLGALSLVYGAVLPTVPEMFETNPDLAGYLGAGGEAKDALVDAYVAYAVLFMAVLSSGFAVSSVLHLRAEEEAGRAGLLVAGGQARWRWFGSGLVATALASLLHTVAMGVAVGAGHAIAAGDAGKTFAYLADQIAYWPGVLVLLAVTGALVGLAPRLAPAAWLPLAVAAFVGMLGEGLSLPDTVSATSPFWHLAAVPVEPFSPGTAALEVALAAVLIALGMFGFIRRDLD